MSIASTTRLMPIQDYLDGELSSDVKHEYLGGVIHAMAGGRAAHNRITGNCFGLLFERLRGRKCVPFNSDMKVRIQSPTQTRFYYPDLSVVCDSYEGNDTFQDRPALVAEVLSKKTRRIDIGEKKEAYLTVPSLKVYLLIEQESAAVTIYRRGEQGFQQEIVEGMEAVIALPEIEAELALAELYEGVDFSPEPEEDPLHS